MAAFTRIAEFQTVTKLHWGTGFSDSMLICLCLKAGMHGVRHSLSLSDGTAPQGTVLAPAFPCLPPPYFFPLFLLPFRPYLINTTRSSASLYTTQYVCSAFGAILSVCHGTVSAARFCSSFVRSSLAFLPFRPSVIAWT